MSLFDRWGRPVTDLRISVTDRCNFRCLYCHNEGQGPVRRAAAPADELSVEELLRIARVGHALGIRAFKLSGGEPLVREDLEALVRGLSPLGPTSLVTNGSMLARRARALAEAGLSRINVSLDVLDPQAFAEVRKGHLTPVLEGVAAALEAGLSPVKLNVVLLEQTVRDLPRLLDFVRERPGLQLQLIQHMPELNGRRDLGADVREVHALLARQADRVDVRALHHRRVYQVRGATVEVVDPVQNPEFCANCHRLRLTARGGLKGCLNRTDDEVPLRGLPEDELRTRFLEVVAARAPFYLPVPAVPGPKPRRAHGVADPGPM